MDVQSFKQLRKGDRVFVEITAMPQNVKSQQRGTVVLIGFTYVEVKFDNGMTINFSLHDNYQLLHKENKQ